MPSVLALGVGCGDSATSSPPATDGGTPPPTMDSGTERPPPTFAPTFTAIYREIILTKNCTLGLCHGDGGNAGSLLLTPQQTAYEALVNVEAAGTLCLGNGLRVEPGEPDRSLFFLKHTAEPPCGLFMPPDELLSEDHIEQIRSWIELGAPND